MADKTVLVVGTFDTKEDELGFLADVIRNPRHRRVAVTEVRQHPRSPGAHGMTALDDDIAKLGGYLARFRDGGVPKRNGCGARTRAVPC